jgi:hypothetical protein
VGRLLEYGTMAIWSAIKVRSTPQEDWISNSMPPKLLAGIAVL